jgi:hypothetical protein
MRTSNRVFLVVNLLIGAFLLGSMSSQSVSASESNAISACANKSSGALRISSKCTKSERPITWNQTGVAGPTGPTGAKGSDAYVITKLVTIRYIGDGTSLTPCGDGKSSLFGTATTYANWQYGSVFLTNRFNWQSNPYCSITLRVVQ